MLRHILSTVLVLAGISASAQTPAFPPAQDELFYKMQSAPDGSASGSRISVVKADAAHCAAGGELVLVCVITPGAHGYTMQLVEPDGTTRVAGTCLDPEGFRPDGIFLYYDESGVLLAEAYFVNGKPYGLWRRHNADDHRGMERARTGPKGMGQDLIAMSCD